jgi:D-beta-D-heptose 7-phosphate kinase / D-beta-D-heptose 1-phosphate adenosyltransferase
VQGVVISDYKKGVLSADTLREIITMASAKNLPVLIDPKGMDYAAYQGATALTPNLHELHLATGLPVQTPAEREVAGRVLLDRTGAQGLVLTCGKDGMVLYEANGNTLTVAAEAREVFDVTGAGDTVIATLAMAHVGGGSLEEATRLANTAAGIVVGKLGTATVSRAELRRACDPACGSGEGKLMARNEARIALQAARAQGKRVVLTNGCFDLLHAGHVQYLQSARAMGELLVIGLNSDASVRDLKGPSRPLVPERERALVLAALACVDAIVLFDEPTPAALVAALEPDILVKGADYEGKEVVGRDTVERGGGRVELLPLYEGQSTTGLVNTILERYRDAN